MKIYGLMCFGLMERMDTQPMASLAVVSGHIAGEKYFDAPVSVFRRPFHVTTPHFQTFIRGSYLKSILQLCYKTTFLIYFIL
jgi:hypothetical protein